MQLEEFNKKIEEHWRDLLALAILKCRDRELAMDLVQSTVEKALRAREGYVEQGFFKAWLFRILQNEYISGIRARARATWGNHSISVLKEGQSAEAADAALDLMDINKAIEGLSDPQRDVLRGIGQGHSYDEVARDLGISMGTVKSRLWRARASIRRVINE